MNVQITSDFIREIEFFIKSVQYKKLNLVLKEKCDEYDDFGGNICPESSFELSIAEKANNPFPLTKNKIEEMINDIIDDKSVEYLSSSDPNFDEDDCIPENLLPIEIREEIKWQAVFETYLKIAEQMVQFIKKLYPTSGAIHIYSNEGMLLISEAENVERNEFETAMALFNRVKTILEMKYPEFKGVAIDLYSHVENADFLNDLHNPARDLLLLGKLKVLEEEFRNIPPDAIYSKKNGENIIESSTKQIKWDYTCKKVQIFEK